MSDRGLPRRAPLLDVHSLRVTFRTGPGESIAPVENVSFQLGEGERLGLVGESGSGKSLTALALLGLIPRIGGRTAEESQVLYRGQDLLKLDEAAVRQLRGGEIAMIFQDPLTSLNPVHKIGRQVLEAITLHRRELSRPAAQELAVELMRQVDLPRPEHLLRSYPHELSGGMRQRVMIAMALAGDPSLLIADEPTSSLDVTIQAEILDLIYELCETRKLAVLLITHDLSIVAGFTHRVMVMYGGRIIEHGPTEELYRAPRHPYTGALLGSIPPLDHLPVRLAAIPGVPPEPAARPVGCAFHPRCPFEDMTMCRADRPALDAVPPEEVVLADHEDVVLADHEDVVLTDHEVACVRWRDINLSGLSNPREAESSPALGAPSDVLLSVRHLSKRFRIKGLGFLRNETVTAVNDVSVDVHLGEALGIVGESGSGKSTLARCMLRLMEPSEGTVSFEGVDLATLGAQQLRRVRQGMQMIFQDPGSSLDPRMRVRGILTEPMRIHRLWQTSGYDEARLKELLELVQLPPDALQRYPHQFSGGQRQRIAIARSLALRPKLLVCDEPVSALDVSVRSSILNLLSDLRDELDLTLVFIAHDLALVRFLCDRVAVMYDGGIVELEDVPKLFEQPQHRHTRELLDSQPIPDPARERQRREVRRESALAAARNQ